jgi:hypothetical protein
MFIVTTLDAVSACVALAPPDLDGQLLAERPTKGDTLCELAEAVLTPSQPTVHISVGR